MFDMVHDPHETKNMLHGSRSSEVEAMRKIMRSKLLDYEREWGLEGYVHEDDFKVGAPYQPHPQRNEAYPRFPLMLTDESEKNEMNDFIDEIAAAVADEPIVRIKDLDIHAWQKNLNIADQDVRRLLDLDEGKAPG